MTETQRNTIVSAKEKMTTGQDFVDILSYIAKDVLSFEKSFSLAELKYLATCKPEFYRQFTIKKKNGGERIISAPKRQLKNVQSCLNVFFQAIYKPSKHVFGFVDGKSVADNARYHINQRYIFNIDLQDFFPSIERNRIASRLKTKPFRFSEEVALLIAGLSCMTQAGRKVLPQGSPVSPILSNIIAKQLDNKLNQLANKYGVKYSRYADDITFSSMNNVYRNDKSFCKAVERIVTEEKFIINENKVRLNRIGQRMEITGLTVSESINVSRKYVKTIRAILNNWEKSGYKKAYSIFITKYMAHRAKPMRGIPDMEHVLDGKLNYLKMIKGETDSTYLKLRERLDALKKGVPISKGITKILDIWEEEDIEAAKNAYYKVPPVEREQPSRGKLKSLEHYTFQEFCEQYNVSVEFETVKGKIRAFINGEAPSFNGHNIYVSKNIDLVDKDKLSVNLLENYKGEQFWLIQSGFIKILDFVDLLKNLRSAAKGITSRKDNSSQENNNYE